MTVAELIAALQAFPPETRVLVDGYEGGFDDPRPPKLVTGFATASEPAYFGKYDTPNDLFGDPAPVSPFDAVVLRRPYRL